MSHKYDKLLSWARSNGAIIPNSLTFPSPYGHCRTTTPIDKGTHLFHIPHTILITPAVASSALPQLKDVCVHARMCAFIALERRKEGFWKEYLDSLPEGFSTPPYFGERELGLLKGTNLSFAWRDRTDIWKKEFNHVKATIGGIGWDDYLWAATVLSSRSFPSRLLNTISSTELPGSTIATDNSLDSSDPILIPVMDMLNHRPNHLVTWLISSNTITFVADTSYLADTEIFNNYGAKGNEELLMGYGFCIVDNPHESISLKLPGESTLYSITRHDLAPAALIQKFCKTVPLTSRERLTGTKSRRNLYEAYASMLRAFSVKMSVLGHIPWDVSSETENYAAIYRASQRDLYILAYNHIVGLMDSIVQSEKLLSMNDILRRQKRKKKKKTVDPDEVTIKWLCQIITNPTEAEMSGEIKEYLKSLIETFYERINWTEYDGLKEGINEECADLHEEVVKRGMDIKIDTVRIVWEIWQDESMEILDFPDPTECFAKYGEVRDLQEALAGEPIDTILLKEEIKDPGIGTRWDPQELIDLEKHF